MTEYGDAFNAAVAAELRAQRGRARVTFDQLSNSTGLAKTTVLNYLNGRREIPMSAFADLCRALGTSQRAIFEAAQQAFDQN
jgi:transcriptional regulator with XRE-family HTH domain